jgi:hypothetical protein
VNDCGGTCSIAGILEQSMGARNRVGIGLSYRPARLQRLAELIPGLLKTLQRRHAVIPKSNRGI